MAVCCEVYLDSDPPIARLPLEVLNSTRLLCIAYYELSEDTAAGSAALTTR